MITQRKESVAKSVAGEPGFEPGPTESESGFLACNCKSLSRKKCQTPDETPITYEPFVKPAQTTEPPPENEKAGGCSAGLDVTLVSKQTSEKARTQRIPAEDFRINLDLSEIADRPLWVAWREELRGDRKTKVPYSPKGVRARSNDPATWGTRRAAEKTAKRLLADGRAGGVGIMFGDLPGRPGWRLGGVDLDSCRDPSTGALTPWADAVIGRFGSYAEVSPSGTGVKVFFAYRADDADAISGAGKSFSLGDHREIALHLSGRYFTLTGDTITDDLLGDFDKLRGVGTSDLRWLVDDLGPRYRAANQPADDLADLLDEPQTSSKEKDDSGSGHGFRRIQDLHKAGLTRAEIAEAMGDDDGPAGEWWGRIGFDEGWRQINRAIRKFEEAGHLTHPEIRDRFDRADVEDAKAALSGARRRITDLGPDELLDRPPQEYVIKGLIAPGQIGCIFGDPGAGKSLIAPYLGYAVAQGREAFGMRTRPGAVLYVAAEDEAGMAGRVAALRAKHGPADGFRLIGGVSNLFDPETGEVAALAEIVKARRPKLVVIDTLAMAFPGMDENTVEAMTRVVDVGRQLARLGAAVVFIHHGNKADGSTPRGHSALNGALDMSMLLRAKDDHGVIRGELRKNRNGAVDRTIAFTIGTRETGVDIDGETVLSAFAEEYVGPAAAASPKIPPAAKAALDHLAEIANDDGEASLQDWQHACIEGRRVSAADERDSRRKAWKRATETLTRTGRICVSGDGTVRIVQPNPEYGPDDFPDDGEGEA